MSGKRDHSYRLWLLLSLEIWHDIYLEQVSPDDVVADVRQYVAP
jgi:hypothetical protein